MDEQKGKRASRVGRALSWIAGPDFTIPSLSLQEEQNTKKKFESRNRIRKTRPKSLYSFLSTHGTDDDNCIVPGGTTTTPSEGLDGPMYNMRSAVGVTATRGGGGSHGGRSEQGVHPMNLLSGSGTRQTTPEHVENARPPPFFYPRPLSTILQQGSMTLAVTHRSSLDGGGDGNVSISSIDSNEISLWRVSTHDDKDGY